MINFEDVSVQVAIISGVFTVFSSLIAALCALLVGKRFLNQEKLKKDIATACADISYLLEVERIHCSEHQFNVGQSNKVKIRGVAKENGFTWSGKFTPGRAKDQGLSTPDQP